MTSTCSMTNSLLLCGKMESPLTSETKIDTSNSDFEISYNNKSSMNPLKKKLLPSDQQETIPIKKRHIDLKISELFFGLPNTVKNLIYKYKRIEKLHEWQEKCLNTNAIHQRRNLVYAVPTSGGKTLVAEILMLKEIVCRRKNALFILPYVASVQEKIQLMTPFAAELNFLIEKYYAETDQYLPNKIGEKSSLYICTIEKAQEVINCLIESNRLDEIGIIVVDELHLLGESGGRGATLECLLTKVIYSKCNVQIIGMSATIGNLDEIALFLNAELYVQNFRPINIKEYVKCGSKMWLVDLEEKNIFTNEEIIEHKYTKEVLESDPDILGHLVLEVVPKDSCLVFCSTKKNCESVVTLLSGVLQGQVELKSHKANEKLTLLNALKNEGGQICPVLRKTIPFGFAYHHSELTAEERRLIEEAFRSGVLCVICCTSTLAAGVNLPARRVILRSPYISTQFLKLSHYKQMIGRAGRTGLGEIGESIIVCSKKDFTKVRQLLKSNMDDSISRLHKDRDRGIKNLIASAVLLSMASTRADLHRLVSKTLLKVQEGRLLKPGVILKEVADEALVTLVKDRILMVKKDQDSTNSFTPLDTTGILEIKMDEYRKAKETGEQKIIKLANSTQLELCPLGKAAIKGLIDLKTAHILYQDLKIWIETWKAKENLDSEDQFLHLIYLITPCEIARQVKIENDHCDIILRLRESKIQAARLLGINEAVMIKIRTGMTTPDYTTVVKRFYVTLILHELSQQQSIHDVAKKYEVDHRTIKNLLSSASLFSSHVRFCQEFDEFRMITNSLSAFAQKLTHYGAADLKTLMKLPFVQEGRATQLYTAGYKTLQSIAKANPEEMLVKIKHLSKEVASKIISDAEVLVREKEENLPDEAEKAMSDLEI